MCGSLVSNLKPLLSYDIEQVVVCFSQRDNIFSMGILLEVFSENNLMGVALDFLLFK